MKFTTQSSAEVKNKWCCTFVFSYAIMTFAGTTQIYFIWLSYLFLIGVAVYLSVHGIKTSSFGRKHHNTPWLTSWHAYSERYASWHRLGQARIVQVCILPLSLLWFIAFHIQMNFFFLFWWMYHAFCTVYYYLKQQVHNIYIYIYLNNILYIVSTHTCFDVPASSSGSLILLLC